MPVVLDASEEKKEEEMSGFCVEGGVKCGGISAREGVYREQQWIEKARSWLHGKCVLMI